MSATPIPTSVEVDLVHDSPQALARLAAALTGVPERICSFGSAAELLARLDPGTTRCILVPADLGGIGARRLIETVRDRRLPVRIVVLARPGDVASAARLLRAGASDVLESPAAPHRLRAAVRQALADASA